MSTPIDNEKYPPSGDGAKLPGLASPSNDVNQLIDQTKKIVEQISNLISIERD
jgi:hypothetical protein